MRMRHAANTGMQRIVDEYRACGQPWPASSTTIARWTINNKKWDKGGSAMVQLCAREIAKALHDEYYTDPQGRRVRVKHAVRTDEETLWGDLRTEPREFIQAALSQRRKQIVGDCRQLKTDVDSYNDNHCDGDPIQLSLDFSDDVVTHKYDATQIDPDLAAILS